MCEASSLHLLWLQLRRPVLSPAVELVGHLPFSSVYFDGSAFSRIGGGREGGTAEEPLVFLRFVVLAGRKREGGRDAKARLLDGVLSTFGFFSYLSQEAFGFLLRVRS